MCCYLKTIASNLFVLLLVSGLLSMSHGTSLNGFTVLPHLIHAEDAKPLIDDSRSLFYSPVPSWSAADNIVEVHSDVDNVKRNNISSSTVSNTSSNNYPSVYPNPVGSEEKVKISAEYANPEGITDVQVDIRGPNLGSAKLELAPPIIGSLSLSLVSGTVRSGIWNGSFTFQEHIPDGSYIYSVKATDTSGDITKDGPFSAIILNRYSDDNGQESETKIVSAIDGNGKHIPINGTTSSSNITFVFNGTDRTGVVLEFQCNMDDTIVQTGHEHAFDPSMPVTTYTPCFIPDNISRHVTGSYAYANLAPGNHTFKIRVVDNEYIMDNSPDIFSWTILSSP
jgi:hypothetical protein